MKKDDITALVLGGGGARGAYQIGVWQGLREMDLNIDIIAGCSVGAINGAVIAQDSFELAKKLWEKLKTGMVVDIGKPRRKNSSLTNLLKGFIDENKIRDGKIDYGLVTIELPGLTPRYFFLDDIPKGKLIDYISASASLFPAIRIADIDDTKFVDGGYLDNLPVGMALKKGATHIIAVDLETAGIVQKEPLRQAKNLTLIKCKWPLGDVMIFDTKNVSKNIRLGYLDTLKAFGFFDGNYYAFSKGEVKSTRIDNAEAAARIFDLDPRFLYTHHTFNNYLKAEVLSYRNETEREIISFHNKLKNLQPDRELLFTLLKKINQKTLTLIIAERLKENQGRRDSLLAKPASLLFKEESRAADYIISEDMI